jgi:hypothetical protein
MFETWWTDWSTWWEAMTPQFAFLLALPFAVVALAFLGDFVRERRHRGGESR